MEHLYLHSAEHLSPPEPPRFPANELLPFTVRIVRNEHDLRKAVQVRHCAYERHLPDFAQSLRAPEAADFDNDVAVLLAESKLDGSPLGTMRIQTNRQKPLALEQSIDLPQHLTSLVLAEATRLGVVDDRKGRLVKTAIFKAYYEYCKVNRIDYMVIAGRSPIDRQYDRLLFEDVYPGRGYIPLRHAGNLPHRVMALAVPAVFPKWKAVSHPLYDYFFNVNHVDINVRGAAVVDKTHSKFEVSAEAVFA